MTDQPATPDSQPATTVPPLFRRIAGFTVGINAGLAVAFVLVVVVEIASAVVHPFPPGFKGTPDEMCAHVARYPAWVLAMAVVAWGLSAFAATWVARRLGAVGAAITVGGLLTAAVLLNISMLPYPLWFKLLSPIAVVGAVFAATRSRSRSGSASPTNFTGSVQ